MNKQLIISTLSLVLASASVAQNDNYSYHYPKTSSPSSLQKNSPALPSSFIALASFLSNEDIVSFDYDTVYIDKQKTGTDTTISGAAMNYISSSTYDSILFENNRLVGQNANARGGAIYAQPANIVIENSYFKNNYISLIRSDDQKLFGSQAQGGAIFFDGNSFSNNKAVLSNVVFEGNYIAYDKQQTTMSYDVCGGAIYNNTNLDLNDVVFTNNYVSADSLGNEPLGYGGAIVNTGSITFNVSENKHLVSHGNVAASGGFISTFNSDIGETTKGIHFNIGTDSSYTIGLKGVIDKTIDSIAGGDNSQITKQGQGSLIINSDNSEYRGKMTVQEGTLEINGKFGAYVSMVIVENGATLSGSGILQGSTYVNTGGFLFAGSNDDISGTLTLDELTLDSYSTILISDGNSIVVTGALDLSLLTLESDKIIIDWIGDSIVSSGVILSVESGNIVYSGMSDDLLDYFEVAQDLEGYLEVQGNELLWFSTATIPEPSVVTSILAFLLYAGTKRTRRKSSIAQN